MTAMPQRPPTRRPLTDQNDPPPPSLPPRPGGRGAPRPPLKTPVTAGDSDDGSNTDPEDYVEPANKNGASNDDQPEEVYDDFDEKPPPLPPHPPADPEGQEIYDDCNEEVQEIYDDLNEELPRPGPIVQHLPKKPVRNLPPPPPPELTKESRSVYEFDPDESGPQVPPSPPEGDSVYEVGDSEMSSPLPPPLPPPKDQKKPEPRLHPQPKGASTSVTKLPGGPGMFINPNQLLGLKKNLRKVSTEDKPGEKNNSAHEPKEYGDCSQTVFEVKRKLEGKADGRPGISLKPVPKSGGVNTFSSKGNNSTVTNGSRTQNALKPNHAVRSPPVSGQQSTSDVTFLPKANKDKHTNVPLPPVPAPHQQQKPAVSKFEFKPEVVMPPDPEEIYDDATSGDLLERYEWFHGIIDRQNGESRVKSVGKDGTYLVRVSEKDPTFPYTLVVLHNSHVNNLRIRKRQKDGKFALGDEKSDELAFTDVPAMISHHKNHHVVLLGNSQSHVKLQQTPPKG